MGWWCTGVRWEEERGVVLGWTGGGRERVSPLVYGGGLAFEVEDGRWCLGLWRGGSRVPCPVRASVPARWSRAQCEECAGMDRARSVAADTFAGDPRPYHVYLAWFGPAMVKVGITGVARGPARLLEQGAVAFTWLGRGPLMSARRAEESLRTALGVPDRIPYADKRAVRAFLPDRSPRAAELARAHASAVALASWPESLVRMPCSVVDHSRLFGLDGLPSPTGVITELTGGGTVAATLLAAAGPDLHLREAGAGGRVLVLDSRLMSGWRLTRTETDTGTDLPVRAVPIVQEGLF